MLHGLPLSDRKDIDHLAVGPGGALLLNSKSTTYAVTASPSSVKCDGRPQHWVESLHRDMDVTSDILTAATRMDVPVAGRIVVWSSQTCTSSHPDVVCGDELRAHLAALPAIYPAAWVDAVFSTARRSDIWKSFRP